MRLCRKKKADATRRERVCQSVLFSMIGIVLFLAACANNTVPLSKISLDYMKQHGIINSRISELVLEEVKEVKAVIQDVRLEELSANTGESLVFLYYNLTPAGEDAIQEDNWVKTSVTIRQGESVIAEDLTFYLPASKNGSAFSRWQRELLGKKSGEELNTNIPEGALLGESFIQCTIEEIYRAELRPDPWAQFIKTGEGLKTLTIFYDTMIKRECDNAIGKNRFIACQQFITDCLARCRFELDPTEVETYAKELLKGYREEARMFGHEEFEEYWTNRRENSIGVPVDPDPYVHAVKMAERDIEKMLFFGAMLEKLSLSLTDDEAKEYYGAQGRGIKEETMVKYRYHFQEELVIRSLAEELKNSDVP